MAQPKPIETSAKKLRTLSSYVQSLAEMPADQGGVTLGEILGSRVDRVRLFQERNHQRSLFKDVLLRKDEKATARSRARIKAVLSNRKSEENHLSLENIIEEISDPEISIDLTMDMKSGAVSLAVEMEPALEGQDLSLLTKVKTDITTPVFDDEPFGDEYWSAEEAAEHLGVAKSTITRRIKNNELIGFKLFKNALYVPREQIEGKSLIFGISQILELFLNDHRETWRFLSSALFYGEELSRPIDRLRGVKNSIDLQTQLSELKSAKTSFDFGDHV